MSFGGMVPKRDFNMVMVSLVRTPVNPDCYIDIELAKAARDKLNKLIENNKNGKCEGERSQR